MALGGKAENVGPDADRFVDYMAGWKGERVLVKLSMASQLHKSKNNLKATLVRCNRTNESLSLF